MQGYTVLRKVFPGRGFPPCAFVWSSSSPVYVTFHGGRYRSSFWSLQGSEITGLRPGTPILKIDPFLLHLSRESFNLPKVAVAHEIRRI